MSAVKGWTKLDLMLNHYANYGSAFMIKLYGDGWRDELVSLLECRDGGMQ